MSVEITAMTIVDFDEILEFWTGIEGVGLNESDTKQRLAAYVDRNPGLSLVARSDGQLIGAVLCGHDGRRGYLHHLAVAPSHRRHGLGAALVDQCLSKLGSIGIQKCNIFVYADNDDGSEFWRRREWRDRSDLRVMQRVIACDDPVDSFDVAKEADAPEVVTSALTVLRNNKDWADKAVAQLPDDKLHVSLDANTNSIAVIMKHVSGNLLSRWTDFLTTDGEKPWRNRDDEFVDSFKNRAEVLEYWERGWTCLFDALHQLTAADILKTVTIRGEPHSVPLAIHRSLAHCGYHVGQIIMIARILAGENWETITIPRGESAAYNQKVWGKGHYETRTTKPAEER